MKKITLLITCSLTALTLMAQVKQKNNKANENKKWIGCSTLDPDASFALDTTQPNRGMADNNFLWDNGKTLKIKILSGSKNLQDKVKKYASEWTKYANLKFEFVNTGDAQIRVYLGDEKGDYGHVTMGLGIRGLMRKPDEFTMHFDTTAFVSEANFRGTVLHEFGHALGLVHEHLSPISGIKWKKESVYGRMKATQGWSKEKTDAQLFKKYSISYTNGTKYDPKSIMHYPIPKWDTEDGYSVDWNYELSDGDKALIAALYPKGERTNEVPRVTLTNIDDVLIENNNQRNGLVIYPSFQINCAGKNAKLYYVAMLLDENDMFIKTTSTNYNVNNFAAGIKEIVLPVGSVNNINKGGKNFEMFIPNDELPANIKGKKIRVWFRIFLYTPDELKELSTVILSNYITIN